IAEFEPKECYSEEIAANAALAGVTSFYPDTSRGALWVADVLYVSVRNFGILHLAEQKRYVFSYVGVLEGLVDSGCITPAQMAVLKQLRWMKTLYRAGESLPSNKLRYILEISTDAIPSRAFDKQIVPMDSRELLLRM